MKTYTHVGMTHNDGLEYGLDGVTPTTWKFSCRPPHNIRYAWRLPHGVIQNAAFQEFAATQQLPICSFNELGRLVRGYQPIEVRTFGALQHWYAEVYTLPIEMRVFQTGTFTEKDAATAEAQRWVVQQGYPV